MGFAIVNANNIWQHAYSSFASNLRELHPGESIVSCEWDDALGQPTQVLIPEPDPTPDWRSFRNQLVMSAAYGRITGHNNQTLAILPVLVNVAFLLDSDATRAVEFAGLWNAIAAIAEPTSEEIAALNAIASANNIPFTLNEQGLIT